MKKRPARARHRKRTSHPRFRSNKLFPVIVIAALVISAVTLISANQGKDYSQNAVLSESESGSDSSGSGSSGSGSSGSDDSDDSGSRSSGSGSSGSGSSGSSDSGSGSSGSGSSGSGSSGSGSSRSGASGSGSSGSRTSGSGSQFVTPRSVSPTPVRIDEETPDGNGITSLQLDEEQIRIDEETRDETTGDRTRVQVDEGQTRLEQEIFEGGVRKRVEMRNENGRIFIRVKIKDAFGNETDERLELRPEEGLARLKVKQNGVEQSVKIRAQNDRFVISQEGLNTALPGGELAVTTNFPITVDPETNSITVETPIGIVNVQQLPAKAIEQVLAANVIDAVTSTELDESEEETTDPNKQVVYRIKGVKNTRFLGLIKVDAPILAEVSAITGEQTFVKQPWYLNAFGLLFAK